MEQYKATSNSIRPRTNQKMDTFLLVTVLLLVVFGLIMMFSASYANALYLFGDSYYFIKSQLRYAILGVVLMLIASRVSYKFYYKWAWPIMIVSYILLFLTLFMRPINGAKRWIIIGGFTFQPSELVKFAVIALFAKLIADAPEKMKDFKYGFLLFMGILGAIALIMLQQTHLSGTILILLIGAVLMFVGGSKLRWFAIVGGLGVTGLAAYVLLSDKMEYAMSRIYTWIDPFQYTTDQGYQTVQSLLAIGSGGLMGLGLGNSRQKHLYVPEPQNDFVFSIICEELGFVGAVLVIILFMLFIIRGFAIALRARDRFSSLMAIGITSQIGVQAILNIAVVTNSVPNTGISLPFFSQGGTSLVILLVETGILLSISRTAATKKN